MKYRVMVSKTYYEEHVVEADDYNHALSIGQEIEEFMECSLYNYMDSLWDAVSASDDCVVTYNPVQEHLK